MIELQISEHETGLIDEQNRLKPVSLSIGYKLVSDRFFRDFPPTYEDIDRAINFTEDRVVPYQSLFDGESVLTTHDGFAMQIAELAFNTTKGNNWISVPRNELENVFNRFADIVKGLPPSQDLIPEDNKFVAYLLILREIMHHLKFETLTVDFD